MNREWTLRENQYVSEQNVNYSHEPNGGKMHTQHVPTPSIVSAYSFTHLPEILDFVYDFSTDCPGTFNHDILRETQTMASQIKELKSLVDREMAPDYPVIFCAIGSGGCVYNEGGIEWPLVFINPEKMENEELLQQIYIHEAAHLMSQGCGHDIVFTVILNTLLVRAGYPPSELDYDFQDCPREEFTMEQAKNLSSELTKILVDSTSNLRQIAEVANMLIPLQSQCRCAESSLAILKYLKLIVGTFCKQAS